MGVSIKPESTTEDTGHKKSRKSRKMTKYIHDKERNHLIRFINDL